MYKNTSKDLNVELTQEDFINHLEERIGNYTCLNIVGAISNLHQFEELEFYTYENDESIEEYIAFGNADEEDCDLKICLDCVISFIKNTISGNLMMTLDNGILVQIF